MRRTKPVRYVREKEPKDVAHPRFQQGDPDEDHLPIPKTEYKDAYCERAIELLEEGYPLTRVAANLRITMDTLNSWIERHPRFKESIEIGLVKAEDALIMQLVKSIKGEAKVNIQAFSLLMQNKFGWLGHHRKESIEEKSVQVNAFANLTDEEVFQIARHLGLPRLKDMLKQSPKAIDVKPGERKPHGKARSL